MSASDPSRRGRVPSAKYRDRALRILSDAPTTEPVDIDDRRNWLDTVRHWDPDASLSEELEVRLRGDLAAGSLPVMVGNDLLKPLEDAVSAHAPSNVALTLTGVTSGSTVLHLRPTRAEQGTIGDVPIDSSIADRAVRDLFELVSAANNGEDLRRWANSIGGSLKVASILSRYDLTADMTWRASSGAARQAEFGANAIRHFNAVSETSESSELRTLSGRVTELRESGFIKLKAGSAKNSAAYDVFIDPERLNSLRLTIAQSIRVVAQRTWQVDRLGRQVTERYIFERIADVEDGLGVDL